MMEALLPRSWREEFERAASARREDIAYREKTIRFEARERERRDERAEERRERDDAAAAEFMLASAEQIVTVKVDLDRYDSYTVEALMDKQAELEAGRARIDAMLEEATVLPDGRRVFRSKDGQRVMDETGRKVSAETIDPASINAAKPDWETFEAETARYRRTLEERAELLRYQAKLDDARERLDSGEITVKELKEMQAGLRAGMPDAVRAKLERDEPKTAPSSKPREAASIPDDMDALMRQTGLAVPAGAPSL